MKKYFRTFLTGLLTTVCLLQVNGGVNGQQKYSPKNPDTVVYTTFRVDMSYMARAGAFDTATDFVDLAGTMNNFTGSPHLVRDSGYIYSIACQLTPGLYYYYRFRINGDSATSEFPLGPLRVTIGPYFTVNLLHYFNDYNPAAVPMTFRCNLWYEIRAGHFNPLADYLDVAGNFNGGGAYDLLFPESLQDTTGVPDSIYFLTKLIDTSYIGGPALSFKFRFNSNWNTSELPGSEPFRTYLLQDTAGGKVNRYTCWYDNRDPDVPSPPWAYDLGIQGQLVAGQVLTGSYRYEDVNLDPEGISLYQWYYADDHQGTTLTAIPSADSINFIPTVSETGKFIAFEVTPVAATGDSLVGTPVMVVSPVAIGGVGIDEITQSPVRYYPDPASDVLHFENVSGLSRIEIYTPQGIRVGTRQPGNSTAVSWNISALAPGIYFLRFYGEGNRITTGKFIKK